MHACVHGRRRSPSACAPCLASPRRRSATRCTSPRCRWRRPCRPRRCHPLHHPPSSPPRSSRGWRPWRAARLQRWRRLQVGILTHACGMGTGPVGLGLGMGVGRGGGVGTTQAPRGETWRLLHGSRLCLPTPWCQIARPQHVMCSQHRRARAEGFSHPPSACLLACLLGGERLQSFGQSVPCASTIEALVVPRM